MAAEKVPKILCPNLNIHVQNDLLSWSSRSRKELKSGAYTRNLKETLLSGLLSLAGPNTALVYLPRDGTMHSELDHPMSIINQNVPQWLES